VRPSQMRPINLVLKSCPSLLSFHISSLLLDARGWLNPRGSERRMAWQCVAECGRTLRHQRPAIIVANNNAHEITQPAAENHPILSILSVLLPVQKHQTI
jgi:hypothetical protein